MTKLSTNSVPKTLEKRILTAIKMKQELDQFERELKDELMKAMKDNDVTKIDSGSYYVTLVGRSNFKIVDSEKVSDDFWTQSLNSRAVSAYDKLYGKAPDGVEKSTTEYLRWGEKRDK